MQGPGTYPSFDFQFYSVVSLDSNFTKVHYFASSFFFFFFDYY